MSGSLADRDLRALVAVIEDARRDEPGPAVPWALLDGLMGLIRSDHVGLVELDVVGHRALTEQFVHEGAAPLVRLALDDETPESSEPAEDEFFWRHMWSFIAPIDPHRTGEFQGVFRWTDLYTPTELRDQPLYAEFFAPELKHAMAACLPAAPGRTRRVLFRRYSGRDFSDRDKLILELLRPHLYEVYLHARRGREGAPRLTTREWQVLELAAQGHSNADIARLLFVSLSTVRKHMEHIFDRTGVRTRSAAVARMMPWTAAARRR
ncbi:helix-turn-helix transcriptional regulator [Saccharothrix stipae]